MSALADRIARSLPGSSFELEALVRLVGIEETDAVPTAAVTCRSRARLLMNPTFVAEHCRSDEHLFLLVMHEMWHVLLGHTTLYGRPTRIHNIAFDALINAGLARQHPQPEYRGFFEQFYSADELPELLMRPPRGWPENPVYPEGVRGLRPLMERLYPPLKRTCLEPLYDELVAFLQQLEPAELEGRMMLLGDHDGDGDGSDQTNDPMNDPLFGDVVRRIVAKWPPPPIPMGGRDAGRDRHDEWVEPRSTLADVRRAFADVVRLALRPDPRGIRQSRHEHTTVTVGPGPLPNAADRLHPARRLLIGDHALANQRIAMIRRQPDRPVRALVYLDVSGSMAAYLPHLVDLLVEPVRQGLLTVRQFSSIVAPLTLHDLRRGRLVTSDGTDIDCVFDDLAERTERRAVIVTDGDVGRPGPARTSALLERHVQLHTVLPDDGWDRDLAPHSTIHRLPRLEL